MRRKTRTITVLATAVGVNNGGKDEDIDSNDNAGGDRLEAAVLKAMTTATTTTTTRTSTKPTTIKTTPTTTKTTKSPKKSTQIT